MAQVKNLILVLLVVAIGLAALTVRTVKETEGAILLRLGEIVDSNLEPGLHVIIPLVHTLRKFDARILTIDAPAQRFLTSEKKGLIVDSFVNWRIRRDGLADYFRATGGGNEINGANRLIAIVNKRLRDEFGSRTIQDVISGEREEIMRELVIAANKETRELGIEVVDVRVKRVDLPREVLSSVYQRMRTERERIARELRSKGKELSEGIRADADRQQTVLLAEAYRDAQVARGEGDAIAAQTYATAYQRNSEFYNFYRSLEAYTNTFRSQSDVILLEPDSEFFRYFNNVERK